MIYIISKKTAPKNWDGKHFLTCTHSYNSKASIDYIMYCNVIKEMPNDRLKIKVFGYRWHDTEGKEKIRYIDKYRVINADSFK